MHDNGSQKFFKDETVANSLLLKEGDGWVCKGIHIFNNSSSHTDRVLYDNKTIKLKYINRHQGRFAGGSSSALCRPQYDVLR